MAFAICRLFRICCNKESGRRATRPGKSHHLSSAELENRPRQGFSKPGKGPFRALRRNKATCHSATSWGKDCRLPRWLAADEGFHPVLRPRKSHFVPWDEIQTRYSARWETTERVPLCHARK